MDKENETANIVEIEIDYRTKIAISEQNLYYEQEYHSGGIAESLQINLNEIIRIELREKVINVKKTKERLFGNFLSTLFDSGAHPTSPSYNLPTIEIEYLSENKKQSLKIKSLSISKNIYEKLNNSVYERKRNN